MNYTNWMACVSTLSFLTAIVPGTHNSAAYAIDRAASPWTPLKSLRWGLGIVPRWRVCQEHTVHDQLVRGIRLLDLRIHKRDDALWTAHGNDFCVPLAHVVQDIDRFLWEYRTESVMLLLAEAVPGALSEDDAHHMMRTLRDGVRTGPAPLHQIFGENAERDQRLAVVAQHGLLTKCGDEWSHHVADHDDVLPVDRWIDTSDVRIKRTRTVEALRRYTLRWEEGDRTMFWVSNTLTPQWYDIGRAMASSRAPQTLGDMSRSPNDGIERFLRAVRDDDPHAMERINAVTMDWFSTRDVLYLIAENERRAAVG